MYLTIITLKKAPSVLNIVIILIQFIDCHMEATTPPSPPPAVASHRNYNRHNNYSKRQTHWQHRHNRSAIVSGLWEGPGTHLPAAASAVHNSNSPLNSIHSIDSINRTENCNNFNGELLRTIQEYTKTLIALNGGQSRRLDSIEKKLIQFEGKNMKEMDLLNGQQRDFQKTIETLSHVQRLTWENVESVVKEFDKFVRRMNRTNWLDKDDSLNVQKNDLNVERSIRQAMLPAPGRGQWNASDNLSNEQKLDALAVFLVSTRGALDELQNILQMNISRLLQQTGNLQRRFNNFARRQMQEQQQSPHGASHYPYSGHGASHNLITNCAQSATPTLGVLKVQLTRDSEPFYVMCDDQLLNGGWTIILNRFSGDINFERGWLDYKQGFGNLAGEFFIGLDKLYALTNANDVNELLIVLEDFQGNRRYARYNLFAIGNEHELYELKLLGRYSGDAGDSLSYHAGYKFSTFDNDNDGCVDCNCAQSHRGRGGIIGAIKAI